MRSRGDELVENITSSSNGNEKLLPVCSFRIFDAAFERHDPAVEQGLGLTIWRPKSSIMKLPPSALMCSGAS